MKPVDWINAILDEISQKPSLSAMDLVRLCGEQCAKSSPLLPHAISIGETSSGNVDMDAVLLRLKEHSPNDIDLIKTNDTIVLRFHECPCPLVRAGVNAPFLCNCTTGYTKKVFEALLGKSVEVTLEKSILNGDGECLQIIHVPEDESPANDNPKTEKNAQ